MGYDFHTMVERAQRIELTDVTRVFGARRALEPVTFSLEPGEFVSLLGPSGSGKSTLLRIIAGLERPSSGRVMCSSARRSFVFQDAALLPWRTVLDNVMLPLEFAGGSRAAALAALEHVGLADAASLYPNQLSGGMKMRVSVARAIVSEPSLLLLDEPFAALDERTRHHLQEDLRALWISLGMTVVFVTHSAMEAVFVSNRAIVLSGGPGRVLADRRIDLGRERSVALRRDVRYLDEVAHLSEVGDE